MHFSAFLAFAKRVRFALLKNVKKLTLPRCICGAFTPVAHFAGHHGPEPAQLEIPGGGHRTNVDCPVGGREREGGDEGEDLLSERMLK